MTTENNTEHITLEVTPDELAAIDIALDAAIAGQEQFGGDGRYLGEFRGVQMKIRSTYLEGE